MHGKGWCDVAVVAQGTSLGVNALVFLDYTCNNINTIEHCFATLHVSLFPVCFYLKSFAE